MFQKVYDFDGVDGNRPEGGLIESADKLWGMTKFGGNSNVEVIFTWTNNVDLQYVKVFDFDENNGGQPFGSLIEIPINRN